MGVYIKGMEMPTSCGVCRFAGSCGVHNAEEWPDLESIMFNDVIGIDGVRDPACPLVPVPPHGDLIDRDANLMSLRKVLFSPFAEPGTIETAMLKACIKVFEEAPTIIEAEEG